MCCRRDLLENCVLINNVGSVKYITSLSLSHIIESLYYRDRMELRRLPVMLLLISVIPMAQAQAAVSGSRSSGGTVGLAVGLVFLFIALLILMILPWFYKRTKDTQQNTSQTSEQNQSRSGAEDSQAGYTPLQAGKCENIYCTVDQTDTSGTGEAAAQSNDATYSLVMMDKETSRNK
ncbi:Fc receptor-like protein 5, partial [Clarias magur]